MAPSSLAFVLGLLLASVAATPIPSSSSAPDVEPKIVELLASTCTDDQLELTIGNDKLTITLQKLDNTLYPEWTKKIDEGMYSQCPSGLVPVEFYDEDLMVSEAINGKCDSTKDRALFYRAEGNAKKVELGPHLTVNKNYDLRILCAAEQELVDFNTIAEHPAAATPDETTEAPKDAEETTTGEAKAEDPASEAPKAEVEENGTTDEAAETTTDTPFISVEPKGTEEPASEETKGTDEATSEEPKGSEEPVTEATAEEPKGTEAPKAEETEGTEEPTSEESKTEKPEEKTAEDDEPEEDTTPSVEDSDGDSEVPSIKCGDEGKVELRYVDEKDGSTKSFPMKLSSMPRDQFLSALTRDGPGATVECPDFMEVVAFTKDQYAAMGMTTFGNVWSKSEACTPSKSYAVIYREDGKLETSQQGEGDVDDSAVLCATQDDITKLPPPVAAPKTAGKSTEIDSVKSSSSAAFASLGAMLVAVAMLL